MTLKGKARRAKITDKPHANSKWNKAEIQTILNDINKTPITRREASVKYQINYNMLIKKIDAYYHGELK